MDERMFLLDIHVGFEGDIDLAFNEELVAKFYSNPQEFYDTLPEDARRQVIEFVVKVMEALTQGDNYKAHQESKSTGDVQ